MFERTIKNFNFVFNSAKPNNTVSGGDVITGHIYFDLTKETTVSSLSMRLRGGVRVHWSRRGGRNKSKHSARLEYFNIRSVIMEDDNAIGGGTKLAPGRHVYHFSCQIPEGDFPSSFGGLHGQIAYSLTVSIDRPWHLSKDFETELDFVHHIDTNQPDLWAPLSGSNNKTLCCLWCATGPVAMTASMERKAFAPGETAKVVCDVSNASSRTVTPVVNLQQKQVCYIPNRDQRRTVSLNLATETGDPVGAHTSLVHVEIDLPIPSSASFTITNCRLMDVFYYVEVSLGLKWSHDLIVLFPITLCNTSGCTNHLD